MNRQSNSVKGRLESIYVPKPGEKGKVEWLYMPEFKVKTVKR